MTDVVNRENVRTGMKVIRGPDWNWGDQDGCSGSSGVIIGAVDSEGWVPVRWSNGSSNKYRVGANDKYDLKFSSTSNVSRNLLKCLYIVIQ